MADAAGAAPEAVSTKAAPATATRTVNGAASGPRPPGPAEPDADEDTVAGLRRLSEAGGVPLGQVSREQRAAAVRRLEEEIHARLARWVRLEGELRERSLQVAQLDEACATNRATIADLETQVRLLMAERDAAVLARDRLQAEQLATHRATAVSVERVGAMEAELNSARATMAENSRLLAEAEARVRELTGQLAAHRDALLGIQGVMNERDGLLEEHERQNAMLASHARDLEQALAEARAAMARTEAETGDIQALRAQAAQAAKQNRELAAELDALRAATEARARQQEAAAEAQLAAAVARAELARSELAALQMEAATLAGQCDELRTSLAERETRLARYADEVASLEQAGGQLIVQRDTQQHTIDELHSQLRAQEKLVGVLAKDTSSVEDATAMIRNLDEWVSHQLEADAPAAPAPTPADASSPAVVRLMESLSGPRRIRYPLYKNVFTIGRANDSDMRVGGPYTSRHHARILNDAEEVVIEDLGSANGIMVNEAPVVRCALRDGDVVDIGGWRFRYRDRAPHRPASGAARG